MLIVRSDAGQQRLLRCATGRLALGLRGVVLDHALAILQALQRLGDRDRLGFVERLDLEHPAEVVEVAIGLVDPDGLVDPLADLADPALRGDHLGQMAQVLGTEDAGLAVLLDQPLQLSLGLLVLPRPVQADGVLLPRHILVLELGVLQGGEQAHCPLDVDAAGGYGAVQQHPSLLLVGTLRQV